jgi:hypothetical protein
MQKGYYIILSLEENALILVHVYCLLVFLKNSEGSLKGGILICPYLQQLE